MPELMITWRDQDIVRPAQDVVVRLVALTDNAYESRDISAYLMRPGRDGCWTWTADLPADLRTSYQLCPVRDQPLRDRPLDDARWAAVIGSGQPDPSCPDSLPPGCASGNPSEPSSVLSMPDAPAQPWVARRPGVTAGSLARTAMKDGSVVHLYRSPGAKDDPTSLVVVFDGYWLLATDVTATFDNLAADRAVEPLTVVVVESIHGSAPRGPSRVRSLTVASELEQFVFDELLPVISTSCPIADEADRRVLVGHSLGAVAALHLAARRPDLFGSVVAGSAALWWPGENGQLSGRDVADAYAANTPNGRLFLTVGTEEGALLEDNRRFHATLLGTGHHVSYTEFRGGHDHACWRGNLADGIVAALPR